MSEEHKYCYTVDGKLALPYQYFAGTIGSRFIVALRDEKKILGLRHPKTGKVYVPPLKTDPETLEPLGEDWVEVGPGGEVVNFTIVRYEEDYQPAKPPYTLALIKLDGADTPLTHIIGESLPEKVRTGMRVEAVFSKEPRNDIMEIAYFKPK